MNISGIRTSAGFYDYNTITINEMRSQQVREAEASEEILPVQQEEEQQIPYEEALKVQEVSKTQEPDKGAEEFAKSYQPDAVYELKGAESDITCLDMEKAISDMKKDLILEQYQFFVSTSMQRENVKTSRELESFYL